MRIIYSKEIHDMQEKIRPYLVLDSESMRLVVSSDAPDDIKELYVKCSELISNETAEAMKFM